MKNISPWPLPLCALLLCAAGCQNKEFSTNPTPVLAASDTTNIRWVLQPGFSDEFNGATLDTTKWNNDVGDWGAWSWEPRNAFVLNDALNIRMDYHKHERNGKTLFYQSGIIRSRAKPIQYGYFEARVRAAKRQPGVCPSFWSYRQTPEKWTEIDFIELTQQQYNPKCIDFPLHIFRHPKQERPKHIKINTPWIAPWNPADDYHVYGCWWDEREIRFYVDGVLRSRAKNVYHDQPLDVVLSMSIRRPLRAGNRPAVPSAEGFPTTMTVDYIRVWKCEPIKADNATQP